MDKIRFFEDDFIVLGSDGLFDNSHCSYIQDKIYKEFYSTLHFLPQVITNSILNDVQNNNFKNTNHSDNISIIIIFLNRGYNRNIEFT